MSSDSHSASRLRSGVLIEGRPCLGLHRRTVSDGGLNLRSATWSNDAENQLTSRTVPGYFEVVGQANPGATVTVNTLSTYRRGEYFRKQITAAAAGDEDAGVAVSCWTLAGGRVDARVGPAAGRGRSQQNGGKSVNSEQSTRGADGKGQ